MPDDHESPPFMTVPLILGYVVFIMERRCQECVGRLLNACYSILYGPPRLSISLRLVTPIYLNSSDIDDGFAFCSYIDSHG